MEFIATQEELQLQHDLSIKFMSEKYEKTTKALHQEHTDRLDSMAEEQKKMKTKLLDANVRGCRIAFQKFRQQQRAKNAAQFSRVVMLGVMNENCASDVVALDDVEPRLLRQRS